MLPMMCCKFIFSLTCKMLFPSFWRFLLWAAIVQWPKSKQSKNGNFLQSWLILTMLKSDFCPLEIGKIQIFFKKSTTCGPELAKIEDLPLELWSELNTLLILKYNILPKLTFWLLQFCSFRVKIEFWPLTWSQHDKWDNFGHILDNFGHFWTLLDNFGHLIKTCLDLGLCISSSN